MLELHVEHHHHHHRHAALFIFILVIRISFHGCLLAQAQPSIFTYAACSPDKYPPNSPYQSRLNSFLSSAVSAASLASYHSFAVGNTTTSAAAAADDDDDEQGALYGLYQCRGDLHLHDCSNCIKSAANQIGLICPNSHGAALQLQGCYVRYENGDFLGKLDAVVVHSKCSRRRASNDVEFFRRRDDVLADLQAAAAAVSGFRVSSSGLVNGMAQCLGDLSSADCSLCLSQAVGDLKSLCGSAAAAAVFLGQCYAQYWTSGYYYDDSSADSSNQDEAGKTVAIVVGTLAGIVVLIVLLSVCRKSPFSRG